MNPVVPRNAEHASHRTIDKSESGMTRERRVPRAGKEGNLKEGDVLPKRGVRCCPCVPRFQGSVPKSQIQWSLGLRARLTVAPEWLTAVGAARIAGCPMKWKVAGGGSDDTRGPFSFGNLGAHLPTGPFPATSPRDPSRRSFVCGCCLARPGEKGGEKYANPLVDFGEMILSC